MNHSMKIMGILNITPDSFYDKSRVDGQNELAGAIDSMRYADIIDIGCESSRPGAIPVSASEEIDRLSIVIPPIQDYSKINFSIDTYKYDVAEYALKNGFKIVNDISGGRNKAIFELVAEHNASIVIMHMQGNPLDMQINPLYSNVLDQIYNFFEVQIKEALTAGIHKDNIIIDPGIGFGKTVEHNYEIIKNIGIFKELGHKVLYGVSRKSFLQYKNDSPIDRLPASLAVTAYLYKKGLDIIRTHDVLETISMISTVKKLGGN